MRTEEGLTVVERMCRSAFVVSGGSAVQIASNRRSNQCHYQHEKEDHREATRAKIGPAWSVASDVAWCVDDEKKKKDNKHDKGQHGLI